MEDQCRICCRLPPEIQHLIIEYLDTESLFHYFAASADHTAMALQFARLHPGLFYPSRDYSMVSTLISAISDTFSKIDFESLNRRWEVVENIMASAKNIKFIPNEPAICRDSCKDRSIGCCKETVTLAGLESITIYYRYFRDNDYVCGIQFHYLDTTVIAGRSSDRHETQPTAGIKQVRIFFDSLGIRNLYFGPKSFSDATHHSRYWECLLQIDGFENLQIITDVRS